eukprot:Sspe_Gene.50384::Locus_27990_Transcript_1_1_Confidence_1.000_Length_1449::g.50384::m.50384/K10133/TP53I3; tumor protein p53-inducible protein 3
MRAGRWVVTWCAGARGALQIPRARSSSMAYQAKERVAVPEVMKAVVVGGDQKLSLGEVPVPALREGEVLIKVEASAVNRADLLQAAGRYPAPKGESEILGLECSGTIAAYHDTCTVAGKSERYDVGAPVMALLSGGGYAEYVAVHESHLIPVDPSGSLTLAQHGAIPEAFLTAFQLLFWYGKPAKGDTVLIHAGASGVGTALVQYCREFGFNAFVTAGKDEKVAFCKDLGAAGGCNYKEEEFDKALLAAYPKGADVVLDCVGQSHWYKNLNAIAVDGRLISYGFLSGSAVKPLDEANPVFDISTILRKRISVIGSTLRSRDVQYKAQLVADFVARVVDPLMRTGKIQPIFSKEFPIADAQAAHDYVRSNETTGKVLLRVA